MQSRLFSPRVVERGFRHDEERPNSSRTRARAKHAQGRQRRQGFSRAHAHGREDESRAGIVAVVSVSRRTDDAFDESDLHVR